MRMVKKKSLGQNFLKDKKILDKIILTSGLTSEDNVLEIGPGEGALTEKILKKVKKVVAIEKDERLKNESGFLQQLKIKQGFSAKLKIYFDDILSIDLPNILKKNNFSTEGYKVVANIPYYITGKILRILFQQRPLPKTIVLLVQKEVAERIVAKKRKSSVLSLSVQYYATAKLVDYVPREAFNPSPKVDSAIIKLSPKGNAIIDTKQEKKFFKLIKIGFSSPRKMLIKNLQNGNSFTRNYLEKVFREIGLDLKIRAEDLSLEQWQKLVKFLNE